MAANGNRCGLLPGTNVIAVGSKATAGTVQAVVARQKPAAVSNGNALASIEKEVYDMGRIVREMLGLRSLSWQYGVGMKNVLSCYSRLRRQSQVRCAHPTTF